MKLFLASLASETLDLVIPLLPDLPKNLKVAFIPTAADPYKDGNMAWMEADRDKFISMGFDVIEYDIKGKNETTLREDLSKFQAIFVSGGNTYYLLDEVKKSGFDKVIKDLLELGVVYIGASAGSVIMCPTINHVRNIEHPEIVPEMTDYEGFGLINELIVPHYGKEKYAERMKPIISEWGDKLLLLSDNQVLVVDGDNMEVVTKK